MSRRKVAFALAFVLLALIFGNPGERRYLEQVSADFGKIHHGISLSATQLASMGHSNYHNFLIASTYEYTFGNIKVSYAGIAFMTFYLGSSRKANPSSNPLKSI